MSFPLIHECGCVAGQYPCPACPLREERLIEHRARMFTDDPNKVLEFRKVAREYITGEGVSPKVTPAKGEYNEDR